MRLLDPRFAYVPAVSTDITATWQRHGYDARKNAERRAHFWQRVAGSVEASNDAAASHWSQRQG